MLPPTVPPRSITAETGGWEKQLSTVPELARTVVTNLKYGGFPIKFLARHFDITVPKVVQKVKFFRDTGRILWQLDRDRTCAILMDASECHLALEESEMTDREIEIRRRILEGRFDRH